jgi:Sulfatase
MIAFLDKLLSPRMLAALSIVGAAFVVAGEYDYVSIPFVISVFGAICSLVFLLSGRIRFALVTTWVLLTLITTISAMKIKYMGIALNVYDVYFYQRDAEVYRFLIESYLPLLLISAFIFIAGVAICTIVFRRERQLAGYRMKFGAILTLSLTASYFAYPDSVDDSSYYLNGHRTSSFFVSFKELRFLVTKPPLAERLSVASAAPGYNGMASCPQKGSRPDIVAVLMESAVPPSLYPEIKSPEALSDSFAGSDGRIRGLRVETFGAGTWITAAALMTSLPTIDFGWLRPYISVYLQGRVKHSLPTLLRQCGYKTAVISPLSYPFVNEGPFMTSLGIEDYRDSKKIGAHSKQERDSFYFDAALKYIDKHHKEDGRPLFLFIMTMAAHGPYSYRFDPKTVMPGEPFGNGGEMDEYLRRLEMQQVDFKTFTKKLGDRKRGSIVLDFGDHQPTVTRALAERKDGGKALAHWDSVAYRTYYRISAINTALTAPLPSYDLMDISYMGPTLFQAAGLPIDDVYAELLALRDQCAGALFLCSQHDRIERHLRRLAKAGMLLLDDKKSPETRSAQGSAAKTGTAVLIPMQGPTKAAN